MNDDDEADYDSEAAGLERRERLKAELVRQLSFIKTAVAGDLPVELVRHAMRRITHAIIDIEPEDLVLVVDNFAALEAEHRREIAEQFGGARGNEGPDSA